MRNEGMSSFPMDCYQCSFMCVHVGFWLFYIWGYLLKPNLTQLVLQYLCLDLKTIALLINNEIRFLIFTTSSWSSGGATQLLQEVKDWLQNKGILRLYCTNYFTHTFNGSFISLVVWFITFQKNVEKCFLRPKVMSKNILFCPQLKYI